MRKIFLCVVLIMSLFSFASCNKTEELNCPVISNEIHASIYTSTIKEMTNSANYVICANVVSKEVYEDFITLQIENVENIKGINYNPSSVDVYYNYSCSDENGNITSEGFSLGEANSSIGRVSYDNVIKDQIKVYFYLNFKISFNKYMLIDNLNAIHIGEEDAIKYAKTYYDFGEDVTYF